MQTLSNKEKAKKFSLMLIYIILFILCLVLQTLMQTIVAPLFTQENRLLLTSISSGVISQIQLVIVVLLVIHCDRNGYFISLAFCILNIIGASVNVFVQKIYFCSLAYPCSVVAIIVATILYRQLHKLDQNANAMNRMVYQDELTELPNRKRFLNSLSNRTGNNGVQSFFSMLFIDLDDFKVLNDLLGHQVGDIFLREVAHNLKSCTTDDDFIARTGGDEFAIIIPSEHTNSEVYKIAQKMSEAISSPFEYRNKEIKITATFGIVQFPKDGQNGTELLQHADMAMYRGKSQGKSHIMFFNEEMQHELEKRMEIETYLHTAIEHKELYLEYQPQYNSTTHQLRGFEALCRWASKKLGHVNPGEFIPIAEETNDIVSIGKWIMETACTQYMAVYEQYETPPMLAINISAIQLRDPDFLDSVKRIIKTTNMDTDHLELEITESVCIMAPEIISQIFAQLKNMGIEIAMDDFGTGYSSLSYLRTLPLDIVKIDITFTRTILTTPPEKNLIKTIIAMAHQLGLKVIAEGVEEDEQLEYLVQNQCDFIQGNLFGKPAPIGAL